MISFYEYGDYYFHCFAHDLKKTCIVGVDNIIYMDRSCTVLKCNQRAYLLPKWLHAIKVILNREIKKINEFKISV